MPFRISSNVKPNAAELESSSFAPDILGEGEGYVDNCFRVFDHIGCDFFVLDDYFTKKRQPKRSGDLHMQRMRRT